MGVIPELRARHVALTVGASLWLGLIVNSFCLVLQPETFFDPPTEAIWAALSWVLWGVIGVFILAGARRFRIARDNWPRRLVLHLFFCALMVVFYIMTALVIRQALGLISPNANLASMIFRRFPSAIVMVGIPIYAGLTAAAHVLHYVERARQEALTAMQLEGRLAATELEIVRRQLQPSFVFETLGSIESSLATDAERAEEIILRLADFLRLTLRDAKTETSSVVEQLDVLQSYLNVRRASGLSCPVDVRADDRILSATLHSFALTGFVTRLMAMPPWRDGMFVRLRRGEAGLEVSVAGAAGVMELHERIEGIARSCFGEEASVRSVPGEVTIRVPAGEQESEEREELVAYA
jgi:hypothetical protein